MTEKGSAKAAHLSQIETREPQQRVVLLGASNLSIAFPTVVETARTMFAAPLEFVVAKGFGRSYGQESKFFGKKFSGILQSGLWEANAAAPSLPTVAIVADVGNDLAYEAPVEKVVEWVETTLDRLQSHGARVVLNNVPFASLRTVGAVRYHVFREVLFPSCRLSRKEMLRRAEQLSEALTRLAEERKTPVFSGEMAWYGLDPIHPRRASAGEIWRRMLGELLAPDSVAPLARATTASAIQLRRLKPQAWSNFGVKRRARQPSGRLKDGTTIALY
jgi:hypothetical protein